MQGAMAHAAIINKLFKGKLSVHLPTRVYTVQIFWHELLKAI